MNHYKYTDRLCQSHNLLLRHWCTTIPKLVTHTLLLNTKFEPDEELRCSCPRSCTPSYTYRNTLPSKNVLHVPLRRSCKGRWSMRMHKGNSIPPKRQLASLSPCWSDLSIKTSPWRTSLMKTPRHRKEVVCLSSAFCSYLLGADRAASRATVSLEGAAVMTMERLRTASVAVVSCSLMAISRAAARMLCTIFVRIPL